MGIFDHFSNLDLTNKVSVILLSCLFIFGIVGNTTVIFTFGKSKRRTLFEKRLLLLAIIDLLSTICVPSLFIYGVLTQYLGEILTEPVCKVWISLFPFSVSVSHGTLLFISFERYHRMHSKNR